MAMYFLKTSVQYQKPTFRKFSMSICSRSSVKSKKSSLLISGKRAENTFVVVNPYLDFDERFENVLKLEENIQRRKLSLNILEMKESWDFYKDWNEKKVKLQENLNEIKKRLTELSKTENSESKLKEQKRIEIHRNLLKEELQNVRKNVWSLEDQVICELLNLPNILHSNAPKFEEEVFVFNGENIKHNSDHLVIGGKLDSLEYYNNFMYFLKNEAALFEIAASEMFINKFISRGFVRFSNPDFTRNVLAEGVGVAADNFTELYLLENTESNNDNLHMCGGASLFPFCGFHAKHSVPKHSLPLKYVTGGRHYSPTTGSLPGLYSVNQRTSVHVFIATDTDDELYCEFQSCVQILTDIFNALGLRFKIVNQSPECYKTWESLRASVLVFSPHNQMFIEVGNISFVGDYISKRLKMCYSDREQESFIKVLSGSMVNVQTLLALCLERSENHLFIPSCVKEFMIT